MTTSSTAGKYRYWYSTTVFHQQELRDYFFSTYTGMVYIHSTTKAIRLQCLFRIEIFFPTSSLTFALLQKVLDYTDAQSLLPFCTLLMKYNVVPS